MSKKQFQWNSMSYCLHTVRDCWKIKSLLFVIMEVTKQDCLTELLIGSHLQRMEPRNGRLQLVLRSRFIMVTMKCFQVWDLGNSVLKPNALMLSYWQLKKSASKYAYYSTKGKLYLLRECRHHSMDKPGYTEKLYRTKLGHTQQPADIILIYTYKRY